MTDVPTAPFELTRGSVRRAEPDVVRTSNDSSGVVLVSGTATDIDNVAKACALVGVQAIKADGKGAPVPKGMGSDKPPEHCPGDQSTVIDLAARTAESFAPEAGFGTLPRGWAFRSLDPPAPAAVPTVGRSGARATVPLGASGGWTLLQGVRAGLWEPRRRTVTERRRQPPCSRQLRLLQARETLLSLDAVRSGAAGGGGRATGVSSCRVALLWPCDNDA